jgi:hypothetical protein
LTGFLLNSDFWLLASFQPLVRQGPRMQRPESLIFCRAEYITSDARRLGEEKEEKVMSGDPWSFPRTANAGADTPEGVELL